MADTIPCPACGTDNAPDAVRCHVCDYELRVQLPGPPSGPSKCPRCGSGVAGGASFCQVCGQSVEGRYARPHTAALNVRALFGDEDSVPQRVPIREHTELAPSARAPSSAPAGPRFAPPGSQGHAAPGYAQPQGHQAPPQPSVRVNMPQPGYELEPPSGPNEIDPSAPRGRRRPAPRPRPNYSGFDAGDSSSGRERPGAPGQGGRPGPQAGVQAGVQAGLQPGPQPGYQPQPAQPPMSADAYADTGARPKSAPRPKGGGPISDPGASANNLPRPRARAQAHAEPISARPRPTRGHDEAAVGVAAAGYGAAQAWGAPQSQQLSAARLVLVGRDGREGESFPMPTTGVEIGRHGPIAFPSDPFVSPHHAKITPIDNGVHIADLNSRNGVYLRLTEPTPVYPGDHFLLGNQLLRLDRLESTWQEQPLDQHEVRGFGSPVKPPWALLVRVCVGEIEDDRYHLRGSETTIGREQGEIVFPSDGFLSRSHARVRMDVRDNTMNVLLEDLGSANGTYLRVRGAVNVPYGAMFRVGDQIFRVRHD